jgi:hypothetical protein
MHHSGIQPEREIEGFLHIIGNHTRGKSVISGVGYLKRLLVKLYLEPAQSRNRRSAGDIALFAMRTTVISTFAANARVSG